MTNQKSDLSFDKSLYVGMDILISIEEADLYINHLESELKLIEKQKKILLQHRPFFLFKNALKRWNNDMDELEEIKTEKLQNYSQFIHLFNNKLKISNEKSTMFE